MAVSRFALPHFPAGRWPMASMDLREMPSTIPDPTDGVGGPDRPKVSTAEQLDDWILSHPEQSGKLPVRGIRLRD